MDYFQWKIEWYTSPTKKQTKDEAGRENVIERLL